MYLAKDLKNADIYAKLFSTKYNIINDLELTKADLVMDSFILSDFNLIGGPSLLGSAQLHSMINGLTLFPLTFWYAMITDEFKGTDIISCLIGIKKQFYNSDSSVIILNIVVLIGFALSFISSHNISFSLGKPGNSQKLKQLGLIIGAPMFITLFIVDYLGGIPVSIGPKILLEILIIAIAYIEIHELESSYKDTQ